MGSIYDWSTTASSNASADATVNFAEGQAPSTVNDSARALMARVAAWVDTIGGAATYGGSSNAYTITSPSGHAITAYADGMLYMLQANHTNSGAATVNVDAVGAKSIKTADGGDVASGDIVSGGLYLLCYDGTNFQILNTIAGGSYQPLDADLTAIAALGYTSGEYLIKKTAADTWALVAETAYVHLAGPETINGAKTFTAQNTIELTASPEYALRLASNSGTVRGYLGASSSYAAIFSNAALTHTLSMALTTGVVNASGGFTSNGNTVYHAGNLHGTAITWTAQQTFGGIVEYSSTQPDIRFNETDAGTNEKRWWNYALGGALYFATVNDAFASSTTWLTVTRGGQTPLLAAFNVPVQAPVALSDETSGTLTSASRNKQVHLSGGATLPASGMTDGDIILLDPRGTARLISRPAAHTMYVTDADVASDTTYAHNICVAKYHGSSKWTLQGMP
jgi:hypothetical protein